MARKGWDALSDAYRKRLVRNGISQSDYEAGKNLGAARGHKKPGGVSERQWAQFLRLAKQAQWPKGYDYRDELEAELSKGIDFDDLKDAIRDKLAAQKAYKKGDRDKAKEIWSRRNPLAAREIYWYHAAK